MRMQVKGKEVKRSRGEEVKRSMGQEVKRKKFKYHQDTFYPVSHSSLLSFLPFVLFTFYSLCLFTFDPFNLSTVLETVSIK